MRDIIDSTHRQTLIDVALYVTPVGLALYQGSYLTSHPIAVFFAIVAFTVIAKYILTYRPLVAFKDDAISTFLDHHLELIKGEFEAWHPAEDIEVRVNIMSPGRRSVFSFGGSDGWGVEFQQVLAITAWAGNYSKLERDLEWRPNQGAVGRAFADRETKAGTRRVEETDWSAAWDMAPQQKVATRDVNSVLAVPVYKPGDHEQRSPVGVLCIDSAAPGRQTRVRSDDVQGKVEEYAAELGVIL